MPSHYLNQYWNIVNWTLRNKLLIEIHTFSFKKMCLKMSSGKWRPFVLASIWLTHWGPVTHICVGNVTIIGSDDGLLPGWRQAITCTNVGIVNWTLRNKLQWNVNPNSYIFIQETAFEYVIRKMAAICIGLNMLNSITLHNDVIKWKKIPRYWPFVRGIHRSTVNSPHKGQRRGALLFLWSASE